MRLISASIKNYKLHRKVSVEFHKSVTVIAGPNEAGKSTLVEAIHRGLFLRSRTTGALLSSMKTRIWQGNPEVHLEFYLDDKFCSVSKVFAGQRGSTTLNLGGETFYGDDAERRLAELLGEEPILGRGGQQVIKRWSHLWVWQGKSSEDVAQELANAQKNELLIRAVQELGGASVVQSQLDSLVSAYFRRLVEENFTSRGRPRASSRLATLEKELEEAKKAYGQKREICDSIRQARKDYIEATKEIKALNREIDKGRKGLASLLEKLKRLEALEGKRKEKGAEKDEKSAYVKRLLELDGEIKALEKEKKEINSKLAPLNLDFEVLDEEISSLGKKRQDLSRNLGNIRKSLSEIRLLISRLHVHEKLSALQKKQEELKARIKQFRELEGQIQQLKHEISALPKIDEEQIQDLKKAQEELIRSEAALEAMATGVEVIDAPEGQVFMGERPLKPGKEYTVTERSELRVGDSVVIAIVPGGGKALLSCQAKVQDARARLNNLLNTIGLSSVEEALGAYSKVEELRRKRDVLDEKLKDLGGKELEEELRGVEEAVTSARSELSRLEERLGHHPPFFEGHDGKMQFHLDSLSKRLDELEGQEKNLQTQLQECQAREDAKFRLRENIRAKRQKLENRRIEIEARLSAKIEEAGDREKRRQEIDRARDDLEKISKEIEKIDGEITLLQPQFLQQDKEQIEEGLDKLELRLQGAVRRKVAAETLLGQLGRVDPEEELKMAYARMELARQRLRQEQERAEAFVLVDSLFQKKQRELGERFSAPLSHRISLYLACMFGPGVEAKAIMEGNKFKGVKLTRPQHGDLVFSFSDLSEGTKEQVAAAVRLAIAEILATGHGGCLPVVFDDAFTSSDPSRVMYVQRMLNLAARRGLQIILLTSNPDDYTFVGGKTIMLERQDRQIDTRARQLEQPAIEG